MLKKLMSAVVSVSMLWTPLAQAEITVKPFEADSMSHIVANRKGSPFVLVVWSLDCEYCAASLSALAHARRTHRKLDIVTISTDPAGDVQTRALIRDKLKTAGMLDNAWAFGAAPAEQLRYAIDPQWHGELPRSYWFNARGERRAYSGVITADVLARLGRQ